ncbi:hypothetical protein ABZU32_30595 [Sphaerisporangium sp. NPDC005288]|uniref:sialidase family protein n=1 Tax=Sphaerisporangium sp. NPDC005288 TaxID=3155114 RepID=UPI0033BE0B94
MLSVVSGPHDPRSSWRPADDDADRDVTPHPSRPRQARTSPHVLHHSPPGPSDSPSRGLPLDSPWALPPFGAPTPDERPPADDDDERAEASRPSSAGRHPYARPYGGGAAEPRHSAGRASPEPPVETSSAWAPEAPSPRGVPSEHTLQYDYDAHPEYSAEPGYGAQRDHGARSDYGAPADSDYGTPAEPDYGAPAEYEHEVARAQDEPAWPPRRIVDRPDKLVASGPPRTPSSGPPAQGISRDLPEIRVEPSIPAEPEDEPRAPRRPRSHGAPSPGAPQQSDPYAPGDPFPRDPYATGGASESDPYTPGDPFPRDPYAAGGASQSDPYGTGDPFPRDPYATGGASGRDRYATGGLSAQGDPYAAYDDPHASGDLSDEAATAGDPYAPGHGAHDVPAFGAQPEERIGRPPAERTVPPDVLVASGPPRSRGGRGRHHRDQPAPRTPRPTRRPRWRGRGRGLLTPIFVVVVLLAAAGLGLVIVNWVNSPASSGLRLAAGDGGSGDQAFVAPPGVSGNGSSQVLNAVTSVGSTVVAVGSDTTSPVPRPLFLVSSDRGRTWQLGRVSGATGYQPAGSAGLVTGGEGRWLAAGTEVPGAAGVRGMWTSTDGRSWTAVDPSRLSAFWSGDRITDLARTAGGFVAVGSTTLTDGGSGPVAWVSPDGLAWSRVDTGEIGATDKVRAIRAVVARGDAVVALADPGKGDTTSVILRSPDGGRTWLRTAAALPGVRPEPGALAVTGKGFLLVPTLQKSGAGEVRVYCSELGDEWRQCGVIGGLGREATGVRGLASSAAGVAAVAESGWERYAVFTSTDGESWTESTDLGQIPGTLRGLAITDAGTLVAAGDQRSGGLDNLPVLMMAGKGEPAAPVPLAQISGLTRSARETTALVTAGESFVAVGSVKGDAGIWTSATGQSWKPVASPALGGAGRQAFNDVVHGPHGWLAVGSTTADSAFVRPLLATSSDGRTWRAGPESPALGASGRYAVVPRVVAAGRKGYVLAGDDSGPGGVVAALWFSPDLKRFSRAAPQSLPAGGADVRVEDIVATGDGYLAVGGSGAAGRTSGVVWSSRDGLNWTARKRVIPEGARSASLRRVVVHDQRIVAVGGATDDKGVERPFAAVSTDDGVTWAYSWLPADATATVLDVAASGDGLVAVGSYGPPATEDSAVWTSQDGTDWQRHTLTGDGMTGDGAQWLGAIAVDGDRVVAVGRSTTYTSDHLTLWRTSFSR